MHSTFRTPYRFTVMCGNRAVSLYARDMEDALHKGARLIGRTSMACWVQYV